MEQRKEYRVVISAVSIISAAASPEEAAEKCLKKFLGLLPEDLRHNWRVTEVREVNDADRQVWRRLAAEREARNATTGGGPDDPAAPPGDR